MALCLYVIPDLPSLVYVSVYHTKPVSFILVFCNAIKWVQKTRQVCDPNKKMVCDAHSSHLNVNYSYNYNMKYIYLSDQLCYVYQFGH